MEWDNNRALERLKKISFPHLSGTPSLVKARDIIHEELKKSIPNASVEEFQFHNELKRVLKFWSPIFLGLTVLKVILWIELFWLSMIVAILQIFINLVVEGRIGHHQVFNRFKNQGPISGYNVIGSLAANGKEKKILVLGAHLDTKSLVKITKKGSSMLVKMLLLNCILIISLGIARIFVEISIVWWFLIIICIGAVMEFISTAIFTLYYKIVNTSPGANDNGSGVATVLELASIFSKNPPKNLTLNFALFDAEEIGLQGSSAYVRFHSADLLQKSAWMIDFDEIAGGFPIQVVTKGGFPAENFGEELIPIFQKILNNPVLKTWDTEKKLVLNAKVMNSQSDHAPFFSAKIPAVAICTPNKRRHSEQDNWDGVKPESIEACGLLMLEFIKQLDQSFA